MAQEELYLIVANLLPTDDDPVTADGAAGSWTANTYSFLVAAWYYDDETDTEYAGWSNGIQANWNNVSVGNNEIVHINWTQAGKRPHHYSVYFQQAAAYDLTDPGTKVAEIDGSLSSADIPDPTTLGTVVFATAYGTVILNPVIAYDPIYRDMLVAGHDGLLVVKDRSNLPAIQEAIIVIPTTACSRADYRKLQKWIERNLRVRLYDPITADPDDDPFYINLYGYIIATDHLLTHSKNRRPEVTLRFVVELGSVSD